MAVDMNLISFTFKAITFLSTFFTNYIKISLSYLWISRCAYIRTYENLLLVRFFPCFCLLFLWGLIFLWIFYLHFIIFLLCMTKCPLNILYLYRVVYSSSLCLFFRFKICNLFGFFLVILIYDSAYICRFITKNVRILVLFANLLLWMRF